MGKGWGGGEKSHFSQGGPGGDYLLMAQAFQPVLPPIDGAARWGGPPCPPSLYFILVPKLPLGNAPFRPSSAWAPYDGW